MAVWVRIVDFQFFVTGNVRSMMVSEKYFQKFVRRGGNLANDMVKYIKIK